MGIETLSNWLSLASRMTLPEAVSFIQLRAIHVGGLLSSSEGDRDLSRRLNAPKGSDVLEGVRALKARLDAGDDAFVSELTGRIEGKPQLSEALAQDADRLRAILAGGDTRPLRASVAALAASFNHYGEAYHRQGRFEDADYFYQRSLSFAESSLDPDHAFFRLILNNLAALHFSRGELDQAEFLCRRSLKVTEKVFGKDHLDHARGLVNLADIYAAKGEGKIARKYIRQALPVFKRALGAQHPEVVRIASRI